MDVYQIVTEKITASLEAGTVPWQKPWAARGGMPRNLFSKRPYRGMNVVLLSLGQPYRSPWWLTFRQAKELGGSVRRGEKSSLVTFWKLSDYRQQQADDGGEEGGEGQGARRAPLLRYYHVFNVEQCEGIAAPAEEGELHPHDRLLCCEAILAAMPQRPEIRPDPARAFYSPDRDVIGMPDLGQFETAESYYATLFHELTHATGHPSRLGRPFVTAPAPFGTPDYSREELVAEFGAAFLCAHAGIFPRTAENQAAYLDGWLRVLKGDKRLLPVAAAQAQKAADFILGAALDPQPEEPEP